MVAEGTDETVVHLPTILRLKLQPVNVENAECEPIVPSALTSLKLKPVFIFNSVDLLVFRATSLSKCSLYGIFD